MVGSSVAGLALAVVLLSHGGVAIPIVADQSAFVRRQAAQVEVSLSPQGEMIQEASHDDMDLAPEDLAKSGFEIGRFDFVLGQPNTNVCTATGHKKVNEDTQNSTGHIIGKALCVAAAAQKGAHFTDEEADDGQEGNHPKGCFKADCDLFKADGDSLATTHPVCFFYNPTGGVINVAGVTGTPVCSRPAFVHGNDDTQGCKADDQSDYQVIDDEETCRTAAGILGTHPTADEFRIGVHNASKHLDYVQGCFLNLDRNKVYFNAKSALGDGVAGQMKGRNICNVSSPQAIA